MGRLLIDGDRDALAAGILIGVHPLLGHGDILLRIELRPQRAARRGGRDLGDRRAGVGAQDHRRAGSRGRGLEHADLAIGMQRHHRRGWRNQDREFHFHAQQFGRKIDLRGGNGRARRRNVDPVEGVAVALQVEFRPVAMRGIVIDRLAHIAAKHKFEIVRGLHLG